jgi:transcriptional regulator with XRE-family HTH domain
MKHLGRLISNWRWVEKLTAREAAEMIGLTPSTYSRLERGYSVDGGTLAIVLTWLLQPGVEEVVDRQEPPIVVVEPETAPSLDVDSEAESIKENAPAV